MIERICHVLAHPLIAMGGKVVVWDPDRGISAFDFGAGPSAVGSFSPMPWRRQWARRGIRVGEGTWVHLDRATGRCQAFAEHEMPLRHRWDVYPGTWVVEEGDDTAILAANAEFRGPEGQARDPGVRFYRIGVGGLELLNVAPIPYVAWASWNEDGYVMLAGMTCRERLPTAHGDDESYALGRPALVRCSITDGRWEEVPFLSAPGMRVDLARDFPDRFEDSRRSRSRRMNTETWAASERLVGGERVLLGALGPEGRPELDNLDTRSRTPARGDHLTLAFVSYPRGELLAVEERCHLELALYTPERTLFVLCRDLRNRGILSNEQTIEQLHVMDSLRSGLSFQRMSFEGLAPGQPFRRFRAVHYPECGFLGVIAHGETHWVFRSQDAVNWSLLGDSRTIPVKLATDSAQD